MANVCAHLHVRGDPQAVSLSIAQQAALSVHVGGLLYDRAADVYEGSYEVTPTREGFTLPTIGLRMAEDLRVAPIPSNYGLVTWDGSTLTVS